MYPVSALHEHVNMRRIEISQRAPIFKVGHCLKVHNVPFKLAAPILV